ncbi:hypothetical protein N9043_01930 [bacterium]|nr:hypothetical protein [bacterium]
MKTLLKVALVSVLLSSTAVLSENTKPVYYGINMGEDCVQAHPSIRDTENWYNTENIVNGLIYGAVFKTNDPEEAAYMSIHELKHAANKYYANIDESKGDSEVAIECQALQSADIQ